MQKVQIPFEWSRANWHKWRPSGAMDNTMSFSHSLLGYISIGRTWKFTPNCVNESKFKWNQNIVGERNEQEIFASQNIFISANSFCSASSYVNRILNGAHLPLHPFPMNAERAHSTPLTTPIDRSSLAIIMLLQKPHTRICVTYHSMTHHDRLYSSDFVPFCSDNPNENIE